MTLRLRLNPLIGCVLAASRLFGGMLACWHAAQSARTKMQAALLSGGHRQHESIDHLAKVTEAEDDLKRLSASFNVD